MTTARKKLGEILVQAGVIDEPQLRAGLSEQRRWGGPLGRILVDMRLITEDSMVQALSHQLNLPAVNLDQRQIDHGALALIPGEIAEQHGVIPFYAQGKFLDVAMSDPTNLGIIDELRIRTRLNVRPYLAGPKAIERAISRCYKAGGPRIDIGGAGSNMMLDAAELTPVGTRFGAEMTPIPARPATRTPSDGRPAPTAAARRASQHELAESVTQDAERSREVRALQERVQRLEALVARDEDVLRKLLSLFVEKGVATRDEILERIK